MSLNHVKKEAYIFPIKWIIDFTGGIPIDRSRSGDIVNQCVAKFKTVDPLLLCITPEGTRSKVNKWKTGFYKKCFTIHNLWKIYKVKLVHEACAKCFVVRILKFEILQTT